VWEEMGLQGVFLGEERGWACWSCCNEGYAGDGCCFVVMIYESMEMRDVELRGFM